VHRRPASQLVAILAAPAGEQGFGVVELPLNSDLQGLQKGNEIMFLQRT
jgi:hypothetical protein